jgi:hypothetical protein
MSQQERDELEVQEQYEKVKDILYLKHYPDDPTKVKKDKWF